MTISVSYLLEHREKDTLYLLGKTYNSRMLEERYATKNYFSI